MKSSLLKISLALTALLLSHPADASEPSLYDLLFTGKPSFHINSENDSYLSSDRNYTNGLRISARNTWRTADGPEVLYKNDDESNLGYKLSGSLHLANNMYTGADISLFPDEIPSDDRPYAGWTYIGVSKQRTFTDDSIRSWEFDVGCLGPCAGSRQIQTEWHELINARKPQGWDNQISDSLALQYFYDYQWAPRVLKAQKNNAAVRYADLAPSFHAEVGTVFTSIGFGGTLRVGKMKSYFDGVGLIKSTPKAVAPRIAAVGFPAQDSFKERFLYLKAKARLMLHNSTIEGAVFNDSSPFTQETKNGVLDIEAGFTWEFNPVVLNVYLATRSTEIKAQKSSLSQHKWLGIQLLIRR